LQTFNYDYKKGLLNFESYTFFQEVTKMNSYHQKRVQKKRDLAYYGSVMHFIRALYMNKLIENGFEVRRIFKKSNLNYMESKIITGDSIAFAKDNVTAVLEFSNLLDITYKGIIMPSGNNYNIQLRTDQYASSQIRLVDAKNILVASNGSYYNPMNLITSGYWSLLEKISNLLPFDFQPATLLKLQ
jgi:hypothetical protein